MEYYQEEIEKILRRLNEEDLRVVYLFLRSMLKAREEKPRT